MHSKPLQVNTTIREAWGKQRDNSRASENHNISLGEERVAPTAVANSAWFGI